MWESFFLVFVSFLIPLKVLATDDVIWDSMSFKTTPPIYNIANRMYATFKNTGTVDRTRSIKFSYNGKNFGSAQSLDVLAGGVATVFVDDTFLAKGDFTMTADLYSDALVACGNGNTTSLVASYTKDFFVDGDNDGDGIPDTIDPDDDNDGLPDTTESTVGTDPFNPDTDRDGAKDGFDPCPLDNLNRCVAMPTPTPTLVPLSVSTNSISQITNATGGNSITSFFQEAAKNIGSVLGISEATPASILSPVVAGDLTETQLNTCKECIVIPVIIGEISVLAVLTGLAILFKKSLDKRWYLTSLVIPILAYVIFVWINWDCLRPAIIFPSDNFFCKWFTLIDFGVFGLITKMTESLMRTIKIQ